MKDQIQQAALKWAEAVKTRIPQHVVDLYHPDGCLWGTLSPVIRHGHGPICDYFEGFLQKEGLQCRFIDGVIRTEGVFAFYSGSYEFSWRIGNDTVAVPARFSFVYRNEKGRWLIMEHHSSLFPELPFNPASYLNK